MGSFSFLGRFLHRRARLKGYEAAREALNQLSEADLQDIGLKRYQLGHVARVRAFK
jgi:uncharacterized protein YjiS (DUF1127 family)